MDSKGSLALRPGPIDERFGDASFRFHLEDSHPDIGALLNPRYQRTELDFLGQAARSTGTFVDVGANVGFYALPIAKQVGSAGRVIAIEPDATALSRMSFNIRASGLENVTVVPLAAGDHDGTLAFHHDARNIAFSEVRESGETTVRVLPLPVILAKAEITVSGVLIPPCFSSI